MKSFGQKLASPFNQSIRNESTQKMPSISTIWQKQKRVDCVWLLRLWLLLLEIPQWVQGQAAIWPTGGYGGYQQCPAGIFADGSEFRGGIDVFCTFEYCFKVVE